MIRILIIVYYKLYDMSQLTIYLDETTEQLLRKELDSSGLSQSRFIAGLILERARTQWPPELVSVLGTWTDDDFPDIEDLRKTLGTDLPRESM